MENIRKESMAEPFAKLIQSVSTEHLRKVLSPNALRDIKAYKTEHVCTRPYNCAHHRLCRPCRRLNHMMCAAYHLYDACTDADPSKARDELALRIMYEFMFDRITYEDVRRKRWGECKDMDRGHMVRIRLLMTASDDARETAVYAWL